jgi:hypothetical protein
MYLFFANDWRDVIMARLNHVRGRELLLRHKREGVNATGLQARFAIHNVTNFSCRR